MSNYEIFIYSMAFIAVVGAVFAFIQTPDEQKFDWPKRVKKEGIGYAPEYSRKEKSRQLFWALSWAIPGFVIAYFWWLPWFNQYVEHAHCHKIGSFTGFHVISYMLFVAAPIVLGVVLLVSLGPKVIKVLRIGQLPLPGEKVSRPTKYVYGWRARLKGVLFFVLLISLLGFGVWGYFSASELIAVSEAKWPDCQN